MATLRECLTSAAAAAGFASADGYADCDISARGDEKIIFVRGGESVRGEEWMRLNSIRFRSVRESLRAELFGTVGESISAFDTSVRAFEAALQIDASYYGPKVRITEPKLNRLYSRPCCSVEVSADRMYSIDQEGSGS